MIPKLWQFLLKAYFKTFVLSLTTFVLLLLISRFKELARFAALSSSFGKTALFTFYQLPWILPIAIPLSALLASFLLFQEMSQSHELTAFRSSGIGFKILLSPILIAGAFLSVANGWVVAEIAPFCRQKTRQILYHETTSNPLLLLQRQSLVKINETYLRLDVEDGGKMGNNFLLIAQAASNEKLALLACDQLWLEEETLHGKNFSIASFYPSLVIENQRFMKTEAPFLSSALKKNRPRLDPGSLNFKMLKIRICEKNRFSKGALIELFRRLSLVLAPLTFTYLGASFGIEQGRQKKLGPLLKSIILILFALISYFLGKELKNAPYLALFVFFFPHFILSLSSTLRLRFLSRGKT